MHNICCDNCHSHVAYALNDMEIHGPYGIRQWDMIKLCFLVFFRGRFLSVGGFVAQFLPFGLLLFVIVLVKLIWSSWNQYWTILMNRIYHYQHQHTTHNNVSRDCEFLCQIGYGILHLWRLLILHGFQCSCLLFYIQPHLSCVRDICVRMRSRMTCNLDI